eukprot:tig00000870_g5149.t1
MAAAPPPAQPAAAAAAPPLQDSSVGPFKPWNIIVPGLSLGALDQRFINVSNSDALMNILRMNPLELQGKAVLSSRNPSDINIATKAITGRLLQANNNILLCPAKTVMVPILGQATMWGRPVQVIMQTGGIRMAEDIKFSKQASVNVGPQDARGYEGGKDEPLEAWMEHSLACCPEGALYATPPPVVTNTNGGSSVNPRPVCVMRIAGSGAGAGGFSMSFEDEVPGEFARNAAGSTLLRLDGPLQAYSADAGAEAAGAPLADVLGMDGADADAADVDAGASPAAFDFEFAGAEGHDGAGFLAAHTGPEHLL